MGPHQSRYLPPGLHAIELNCMSEQGLVRQGPSETVSLTGRRKKKTMEDEKNKKKQKQQQQQQQQHMHESTQLLRRVGESDHEKNAYAYDCLASCSGDIAASVAIVCATRRERVEQLQLCRMGTRRDDREYAVHTPKVPSAWLGCKQEVHKNPTTTAHSLNRIQL
jgi:hypothetical protein